jgi:signal transduction histidine kinase
MIGMIGKGTLEAQLDYLGDVLRNSKQLLSLINGLLDRSGIEAEKIDYTPTEIDLKLLLDNGLILIKEKSPKR